MKADVSSYFLYIAVEQDKRPPIICLNLERIGLTLCITFKCILVYLFKQFSYRIFLYYNTWECLYIYIYYI